MDRRRCGSLDRTTDSFEEGKETEESDKAGLEDQTPPTNKEAIRRLDCRLLKYQSAVSDKVEDVEKRINDLYCSTLEAIMKIYRSNDKRSEHKPWESFREAADHLSEMHKLMKTELGDLYQLSERRGSLSRSKRLLNSLMPTPTSPHRHRHLSRAVFDAHLCSAPMHQDSSPTSTTAAAARTSTPPPPSTATFTPTGSKRSGDNSTVAAAGPVIAGATSTGGGAGEERSGGSSSDEDERLENELKRRRTDHYWR